MLKKIMVMGVTILFSSICLGQTKETISGELTFTCDMKPEYMLEKGYTHLRMEQNGQFMTGVFGARDAKVIVRGGNGNLLGMGKSDPTGNFSFQVDASDFYDIEMRFKQWKYSEPMMSGEVSGMAYTFGVCDFDALFEGNW